MKICVVQLSGGFTIHPRRLQVRPRLLGPRTAVVEPQVGFPMYDRLMLAAKLPQCLGGVQMRVGVVRVQLDRRLKRRQRAFAFARSLGKDPVEAKDASGFIVNRLLVPYMLDAIRCLEQGLATTEDIDKSMTLGTGYPMGPFTLCDFVGIDTLYYIAEIMFEEFRETRYAPPPLLRRMVSFGYFGRKTKRGFYDYSGERPVVVNLGI